MKRKTTLTLTVLPLVLAACSGSTSSADFDLPPADAVLEEPCAAPVRLPERELTQVEVEGLWARDRAELIDCGRRNALNVQRARLLAGIVGRGG